MSKAAQRPSSGASDAAKTRAKIRWADHLKLAFFKAAAFVPDAIWQRAASPVAARMTRRRPKPVRQWQLNFEVVKARRPSDEETNAAMQAWFLNMVTSLGLHRWSSDKVNAKVVIDPAEVHRLKQLHANQGLIFALPHMGSWDLAGTWASFNGLPVISVGENLPAGQFEYFQRMRERLGYLVIRQHEPQILDKLADALRGGRVVALVADRDYSRKGVPIIWRTDRQDIEMTLPAGPGLVAQRTGAAVVPVCLWFDGDRMHIELGEAIQPMSGVAGLAAMMQLQADFFAHSVCDHVLDWHMLQRFFPGVEA